MTTEWCQAVSYYMCVCGNLVTRSATERSANPSTLKQIRLPTSLQSSSRMHKEGKIFTALCRKALQCVLSDFLIYRWNCLVYLCMPYWWHEIKPLILQPFKKKFCDIIWYDMIYDIIWYDMIWYDTIRYDMIWFDVMWYDMIWYIWYMLWYDMIWYDMIWYDMIWYDMIWYDMIW